MQKLNRTTDHNVLKRQAVTASGGPFIRFPGFGAPGNNYFDPPKGGDALQSADRCFGLAVTAVRGGTLHIRDTPARWGFLG